jgi:tetratricopeptide (TPR) repeat protein
VQITPIPARARAVRLLHRLRPISLPRLRTLSLALLLASWPALFFAQAGGAKKTSPKAPAVSPAEAALNQRLQEAQAARSAGDPEAIAAANRHLSALALRELAQLRLLQLAYPQAIELYRSSLDLDNLPEAHVDLAIADMDAGQLDSARVEIIHALAVIPDDVRANTVMGRIQTRQHDYTAAAQSFTKAVQSKPDIELLYSLAICLLNTKDPKDKERAATVFRQMSDFAGESGSLHVLFGRAYRDAEDLPAAVKELERAIQLDPKTPHAHYFLGLARLSLNEWKPTPEAKAELHKEAENYPKDFLANYMLGFIASEERDYATSENYLKIAADVGPTWPEPWLYMGLNAYSQGDMKRAEETLRKAVELTGKDEARSNYQIRRAYVDLGRILSTSGRKDEAQTFIAKARDLQNKTMEMTQQSVAQTAAAAGAGDAAGIVALNSDAEKEAAPLLPGNTDPFAPVDASAVARANLTPQQRAAADSQETRLRAILGESLNDLATSEAVRGQYAVALGHFQEAEHWSPTQPGLAKNLGLCAYKVNAYPEAIRGFSRALEEKPSDSPVRALLGMSYFATDKFSDAVRTFEPLGTRGMQDPTVGYAWATALARTADLKQASVVLTQFENAQLTNDLLILVGQLWTEIGDYHHAVDTLHRALQSDPALLKSHYYAGLAYLRWEHWPEAANEFQAELALAPTDADARYNLGFVEVQQAKIDEALALFQQVIAAQPSYANAQYQVGKILLDRGQLDDAIPHLEVAARLVPQVDYVHYQLQSAYRKKNRTADADRELEIYKQIKAKSRAQATVPNPTP